MSVAEFALAFGGGLVSFLSPCVLPLVPAYLSLTTGLGSSDPTHDRLPPARPGPSAATALRAGGLFAMGFSVVFVALGMSATALGSALLRSHIQLTRLAGVVVLAMALLMLATTLPVGGFASRELRFHPPLRRYGTWAAPLAGAAFAFGWTPCIGPVLGSVLAVAADQHRLTQGALLLALYAAGLAVPFLIAALAFHHSVLAFRFMRRHSALLARSAAAVLAAYGLLLVLDRLNWFAIQVQRAAIALGLGRLTGLG